jgi:hypothetical protein
MKVRSFYIINNNHVIYARSNPKFWDRLVLKGVRSNDNDDMGNIIAIDKDSLFLMTGRHVIKIPKSFVQGFNGSEVLLNVAAPEVLRLELT